jgi:DNA-directed RNA polymerase subunit RPC12/RpoP
MTHFWCTDCGKRMDVSPSYPSRTKIHRCPDCEKYFVSGAFVQSEKPSRWQVVKWLVDEWKGKVAL